MLRAFQWFCDKNKKLRVWIWWHFEKAKTSMSPPQWHNNMTKQHESTKLGERLWKTTPLWKTQYFIIITIISGEMTLRRCICCFSFITVPFKATPQPCASFVLILSKEKHHVWLLLLHRNQFVKNIKVLLCYTELISSLLHLSPRPFTILDVLSTGWRFNKSLLKAGGW